MNQIIHGFSQIVRQLGRHERIPSLSTADLLLFPTPQPRPKPLGINAIRVIKSNERFAPYVKTIKELRARGMSLRAIATRLKTSHPSLSAVSHTSISGYIRRNPELFK